MEWLNKCKRIGIAPEVCNKDGLTQDFIWFDDVQVELVEAAVVELGVETSGDEINLGDRVKDLFTGFTGIADGMINGNYNRIRILPEALSKDGLPQDGTWFDAPQVAIVKRGVIVVKKGYTGGPREMGNLNLGASPSR